MRWGSLDFLMAQQDLAYGLGSGGWIAYVGVEVEKSLIWLYSCYFIARYLNAGWLLTGIAYTPFKCKITGVIRV
jgi:hypothetical protein